jgi:hypothetical protein
MDGGIVIFGTGAHARKACQCAQAAGWRVVAFADENPLAVAPVPGLPVHTAAPMASWPAAFVAIGRADARRRLMDMLQAAGCALPPLVHPRASVAPDAWLGDGVIVAAGAVVEGGARIGRGAIVDIGVLVDHDVRVADFCHLRPGQVCPPGSHWPPDEAAP